MGAKHFQTVTRHMHRNLYGSEQITTVTFARTIVSERLQRKPQLREPPNTTLDFTQRTECSEELQPVGPTVLPQGSGINLPKPAEHSAAKPRRPGVKVDRRALNERIVAIIVVCAALVACVHIQRASIWYDEAITLLTTSGHAKLDWPLGMMQFHPTTNLRRIVSDLYEQDVHPPLYFWALAFWRTAFGASLEVARTFSALFILATLILLYWLARDFGLHRPWVPVAVYAASSAGMWYAYDARPYAMATFLIVLTQFLARRRSGWSGICGAAAFATHYFAVLCAGPVLALECLRSWRRNRSWVLLTAFSFVICSAPLLLLLRVHIGARPHQYPGFNWWPGEFWALLAGPVQGILPNTWLPGWKIVLGLGAFFVIAGAWWAVKHKKLTVPVLYGVFLCGFLALALVTNKSIMQMPVAYYLGIAAPWVALLVGYGVNAFPRWSPLLAAAVLIGLIGARPLVRTVDYRAMLGRMNAECSHCPILVGTGYAGAVPACVLYESRGMQVFLLAPNDSVESVKDRIGTHKTIFFVPSNEPPTAQIEDEFLSSTCPRERTAISR